MAAAQRDIDLLVVGEINPDVIVTDADPVPVFGQAERIVDSIRLVPGSSSVIAAMGAARLGLRVAMVGVVGDDALGQFMLAAMQARGIDTGACRVAPGRATGASVILGSAGDRAILTATGTIADTLAEDVPPSLLARARHVHVGSFFLQPRLTAGVPGLFAAARAGGATTSLDPNWDPSGRWDGGFGAAAAQADVLLPNAAEAARLAGLDHLEDAARALAAGQRTVVVKMGPDGALGIQADGPVIRVAAPASAAVVDTTGAGDSFDAGFLAAWLDGEGLEAAVRFAVACGTLSTRAAGGTDGQATRHEAAALARA